jgi:hypothetical protein
MSPIKKPERKPIGRLSVVRNFRWVIEERDIGLMKRELYEFLHLHCGFIAQFNIDGFKDVYSPPKEFAGVFIRHFDREHRYFNGACACHEDQYKYTGYSKAEIKREFFRIVDRHKRPIARWAEDSKKMKRYALFKALK